MRHLPEVFKDFLNILNEKQVRYLIVGDWALGVHGYIRATGDMDIWISTEDDNLDHLLSSLAEFNVPEGISKDFFKVKGNAFRMGTPGNVSQRIRRFSELADKDLPDEIVRFNKLSEFVD